MSDLSFPEGHIIKTNPDLKEFCFLNDFPVVVHRSTFKDEWITLYISHNIEQLTGYEACQYTNNKINLYHSIHPDDQEMIKGLIHEAAHNQNNFAAEYRIINKQGQLKWIHNKTLRIEKDDTSCYIDSVIWDITEKKNKEEELNHTKATLQATLDTIDKGIITLDKKGDVSYINNIACRILNINQAEATGQSINDIFKLSDRYIMVALLSGEKISSQKTILTLPSGEEKEIKCQTRPIRLEGNNTGGLVISFNPTNSQTTEEQPGHLYYKKMELMFNATQASLFLTSIDQKIELTNNSFDRFIGSNRAALTGQNLFKVLPPEYINISKVIYEKVLTTLRPQSFRITIDRNGKSAFYINIFVPILDDSQQLTSMCGILNDISDFTMVEKELKETRERLNFAMTAGNIGMWDYYIESNRVITNQEFCQMMMLEPSVADGEFSWLAGRIHPLDIGRLYSTYYKHKRGFTDKMECEIRIKTGDDKYLWTQLIGRIVERNANNEPTRIIGVQLDVSRKKELMEELSSSKEIAEHANQTKSYFLANLSHEIRTPMNAIIGFSQILSNKVTDPILLEYIHSIRNGGETLMNLINDILDLSKIEANRIDIKPEAINMQYIMDEIRQMFQYRSVQKGIKLRIESSESFPSTLFLDELRIKQIFLNLVSNAIKFTEQGEVIVNLAYFPNSDENGELEIKVTDTGIGIVESNLSKIFEPFVQHEGHDAKKYGGTGLGLSITKKLTELMGGTIGVVSKVGEGSTFTVTIPSIKINSSIVQKEEKKPDEQTDYSVIMGIGLSINEAKVIQKVLSAGIQKLMIVNSLQEAFFIISTHQVDVVFADTSFFNPMGKEMQEWHKHPTAGSLPLVIIVDRFGEYDMNTLKSNGVMYVLKKPLLSTMTAQIIDQHSDHGIELPVHKSIGVDLTTEEAVHVLSFFSSEMLLQIGQLLEIQPHNQVKELVLFLKTIDDSPGTSQIKELGVIIDNALGVFDVGTIRHSIYRLIEFISCLRNIAGYES